MDTRITLNKRRGFSLIELVIVVVIIGIIGAIAIPRLSRGAEGAGDSALVGDLAVLRGAIDLYATEHGGTFPTTAGFVDQLTKYTDDSGATSNVKTATHVFGPYLRAVPPLKVGANKGNTGVAATASDGVGWLYTEASGAITASTTTEKDSSGKLYSDY